MHWSRWKVHGSPSYEAPTVADRFWMRVDKDGPGGCWLWTGALFQVSGYGMLTVNHRPALAHRVSYEINIGPIPDGLHIDHVRERGCTHRHCVNPAHLEPVTRKVNILRGTSGPASNATKTHCIHGHPFSEDNTYLYRGHRICRECGRQRCRAAHPPTGAKMGRPFATECHQGHPMSGTNLYVSPKGKRVCRACQAERQRRCRQQHAN